MTKKIEVVIVNPNDEARLQEGIVFLKVLVGGLIVYGVYGALTVY